MIFSGLPRPLCARSHRASPEFDHQCALFAWARNAAVIRQLPGIDLMSCSLNGVRLSKAQAGKAKAAGMLKGEWDVRLPVARGTYIGLALEMKAGRNRLTPEQVWYGERLRAEGWQCDVCYSWEAARSIITGYLFVGAGSISDPS
jgi:hypothetical protein